jgi:hypothetical protein
MTCTTTASPEPTRNRLTSRPSRRQKLTIESIKAAAAERVRQSRAAEASSGSINIGPITFTLS